MKIFKKVASKHAEFVAGLDAKEAARFQKHTDKMVQRAKKYHLDTDGVTHAMYDYDDGEHYFTLISPDRVEMVRLSSMLKQVQEHINVPMRNVTGAGYQKVSALNYELTVWAGSVEHTMRANAYAMDARKVIENYMKQAR